MLAAAIVGILVATLGSVMLISAKAIDQSATVAGRQLSAASVIDDIKADIQVASQIDDASSIAISLVVPDRDGDGKPDSVRYEWSKSSRLLTRTHNSGTPVPIAREVQEFALGYTTRSTPPMSTSAPGTLAAFDHALLASKKNYEIKSDRWAAQYVQPEFPASAVEWSITAVRLNLRQHGGNSGSMWIQIVAADGDRLPTTRVLGQTAVPMSSLSGSYSTKTLDIGPITGLVPGQSVCIRLIHSSGDTCDVEYEELSGGLANGTHMMTSSNQGSTWTIPSDDLDLRFALVGTVSTRNDCKTP
ncbi:MAG: hypothetical protein KF745_11005 [Phycisphaeraceae bacterium]|nr:hypothetical protein [Phycisphaeraceae bacterium]